MIMKKVYKGINQDDKTLFNLQ